MLSRWMARHSTRRRNLLPDVVNSPRYGTGTTGFGLEEKDAGHVPFYLGDRVRVMAMFPACCRFHRHYYSSVSLLITVSRSTRA
ncbi:hypothetical protein ACLB1Q_35995 [Escherichia coli]